MPAEKKQNVLLTFFNRTQVTTNQARYLADAEYASDIDRKASQLAEAMRDQLTDIAREIMLHEACVLVDMTNANGDLAASILDPLKTSLAYKSKVTLATFLPISDLAGGGGKG